MAITIRGRPNLSARPFPFSLGPNTQIRHQSRPTRRRGIEPRAQTPAGAPARRRDKGGGMAPPRERVWAVGRRSMARRGGGRGPLSTGWRPGNGASGPGSPSLSRRRGWGRSRARSSSATAGRRRRLTEASSGRRMVRPVSIKGGARRVRRRKGDGRRVCPGQARVGFDTRPTGEAFLRHQEQIERRALLPRGASPGRGSAAFIFQAGFR